MNVKRLLEDDFDFRVSQLFKKRNPVSDGEYMGSDGLKHCKKCGEPTEAQFPEDYEANPAFAGAFVPVACKCKRDEAEETKKQLTFNEKRSTASIARNLAMNAYKEMQFSKSIKDLTFARRYVEGFENFYKKGQGIVLSGDVGTGKTFTAGCIMNALYEKGVSVLMMNIAHLIPELEKFGNTEIFSRIAEYDLFILDDFGLQSSAYADEKLYMIVETRYSSGKPMIVTTNISKVMFAEETNLRRRATYDRLIEKNAFITLEGKSMRRVNANANQLEMAKALGLR